MIFRITTEEIESGLGSFFGKIGKFFINIYNSVIDALGKFMPKEFAVVLLIVVVAFIAIYIFTQKINK